MLGISVNFCEFHSRNLYKSFIAANKPNRSLILYFSKGQGSKYLFLGNSHVIFDVGENSGLYEVSLVSMTTTTTFQLCTFFLSTFNQIQNFIKLFFIHLQSKKYRRYNVGPAVIHQFWACSQGGHAKGTSYKLKFQLLWRKHGTEVILSK